MLRPLPTLQHRVAVCVWAFVVKYHGCEHLPPPMVHNRVPPCMALPRLHKQEVAVSSLADSSLADSSLADSSVAVRCGAYGAHRNERPVAVPRLPVGVAVAVAVAVAVGVGVY